MSEKTPYQTLGISEDATFDDIQAVKSRLLQENQGNTQLLEKVEAAYDAIIMERLRLRQEGKIKVPEKIRFPERQSEPVSKPVTSLKGVGTPAWLTSSLDTPSRNEVLLPAGVFAVLTGLSWLSQSGGGSVQSLLLVAGVFANIFFLNRKERKFGRALLFSLGALLLGVGLGAGLGQLLPLLPGAIALPGEPVAATITFFLLWLMSSFLR